MCICMYICVCMCDVCTCVGILCMCVFVWDVYMCVCVCPYVLRLSWIQPKFHSCNHAKAFMEHLPCKEAWCQDRKFIKLGVFLQGPQCYGLGLSIQTYLSLVITMPLPCLSVKPKGEFICKWNITSVGILKNPCSLNTFTFNFKHVTL